MLSLKTKPFSRRKNVFGHFIHKLFVYSVHCRLRTYNFFHKSFYCSLIFALADLIVYRITINMCAFAEN